jgi:hypothetical protein
MADNSSKMQNWRVVVEEQTDGVWIKVFGPAGQGAAFQCEKDSIRAEVLRQFMTARLVPETGAEPDAWMTDDGRICTAQLKNSQTPGKTRDFTIPLYRHPRPWSQVEKAALGPDGVPTSELVVALHKRCNDQTRELARLNERIRELQPAAESWESHEAALERKASSVETEGKPVSSPQYPCICREWIGDALKIEDGCPVHSSEKSTAPISKQEPLT